MIFSLRFPGNVFLSPYKLVPVRAGSGARLARGESRPGSGSCGGRGAGDKPISVSHSLTIWSAFSLNLSLSVYYCRTAGTSVIITLTNAFQSSWCLCGIPMCQYNCVHIFMYLSFCLSVSLIMSHVMLYINNYVTRHQRTSWLSAGSSAECSQPGVHWYSHPPSLAHSPQSQSTQWVRGQKSTRI